MKRIGTPAETGLLVAGLIALAVAVVGPAMPQFAHYHAFADQRVLMGVPFALDVLSNLAFAVMGAWGLPLVAVIAWYCVAKVLELNDHAVFAGTHGWVSGHTLKHVVAALSAWPVITLMHNVGHVRLRRTNAAHA